MDTNTGPHLRVPVITNYASRAECTTRINKNCVNLKHWSDSHRSQAFHHGLLHMRTDSLFMERVVKRIVSVIGASGASTYAVISMSCVCVVQHAYIISAHA